MGSTPKLKYIAALLCFFATLSLMTSPQENFFGKDLALCMQSAMAWKPDTGPLNYIKPHAGPFLKFSVVKRYPHDPEAFTQGLIFANGFLYESTGLNGRSSLRQVELETGRILKKHDLPFLYFAEGLTRWDGSLIQLTWTSGKGFVYNLENFTLEREFGYSGEGWGLTSDGKNLIMSNGTEDLVFLDPVTLVRQHSLRVQDMSGPVRLLNELEFIKGEIFANIWQDDSIAIISPKTGNITGWVDLSALRKELPSGSSAESLNGIAFDAEKGRIFVTGKLWPILFEIEINH